MAFIKYIVNLYKENVEPMLKLLNRNKKKDPGAIGLHIDSHMNSIKGSQLINNNPAQRAAELRRKKREERLKLLQLHRNLASGDDMDGQI